MVSLVFSAMRPGICQTDNIKRMITLSVITLSGFYFITGVLNLLLLAYHKLKLYPLCVSPNKNSTHIVFLHTPCDLLAYPRLIIALLEHGSLPNISYCFFVWIFSTFVYPQIRNSTHIVFLHTPCDLLAYPRLRIALLEHGCFFNISYCFCFF